MNVLGIETSCDETGVALYSSKTGLLAEALHSQIDLHARFGGVVPEIASRAHIEAINTVISDALGESGAAPADVAAAGDHVLGDI